MSRLAAIRSGRSVQMKISGGRSHLWEIMFGFYKTRHILLSDGGNCTVLCAVVLTQYWRVADGRTDGLTDRQTDGIAIASTALAMRSLRRAVKTIMANRKSYMDFPTSHQPRFYAAPNFLRMGKKYLNLSSFGQFRQYRRKVCCKVSFYKNS